MMSTKRLLAIAILAIAATTAAFAQFSGPAPLAWRWQQPSSQPPSGSPVTRGDVVFVASGQRMYALNRTDGNQLWRFPIAEPLAAYFKGTPLLADDTLVCAADNRMVYGVDVNSGAVKWEYASPVQIIGNIVRSGKLAVFQTSENAIMALNLDTGLPFYDVPLRIDEGITGRINTWNDNVLVFSGGRTLYSINVATRKTDWKQNFDNLPTDAFPVVTPDTVYVASGSFLVALNAGGGSPKYTRNINDEIAFSPAISKDGIILVTRNGVAFILDLTGKVVTRDGIDLKSDPFTTPTAVDGGTYIVPTINGSINVINTNGVVWDYPIRPIGGIQEAKSQSSGKGGFGAPGAGGGGPSFGGSGGPFGGSGGSFGGGGGQGLGGGSDNQPTKIATVQAAGPAIVAGQTLLILARDGSLLAFDKDNGVDLTPPAVTMSFPNPGDQINGQPPFQFIFKIEDEASGVNQGTLSIMVDGKALDYTFDREGVATVRFSSLGKNKPLTDGRKTVVVEVSDWMGNKQHAEYVVTIDNTLPPVVAQPANPTDGKGGGKNGGGSVAGGG